MINYFQVLNVSENADSEVIRAAYKALAKKYHPDCCKMDREAAQKQMMLINQATMTDEQKELFEKYTDCVREHQTKLFVRDIMTQTFGNLSTVLLHLVIWNMKTPCFRDQNGII